MRKILIILFAVLFVFSGCEYDDSALTDRLDRVEDRLAKLEELCSRMNSEIESLKTIVDALNNSDYITSVDPLMEQGETVGYSISFSKSGKIQIYNGKDGVDGADGKDGYTPEISVSRDTDGIYYWVLDGEWLLDESGRKIPAEGMNGTDGTDGTDGRDGVTPELKIEDGYWWITFDGGESWTRLYQAVGEDGVDGVDGQDGTSFFQKVDTTDPDYVLFVLSDGREIRIPTYASFESLQRLCDEMNSNLEALQTIVKAFQENDSVESVTPVYEDGVCIGYDIKFANNGTVRIYHGQDGSSGHTGPDGHVPEIGVSQDTDGVYYWTLDGEWLLDEDGNKVKAGGLDGSAGQDGEPGAPGSDLELKIEEGYWFVSTDGGAGWTKLGKATGEPGEPGEGLPADPFFQEVTYDEDYVYFTLGNGTELKIPLAGSSAFETIHSVSYLPDSIDGRVEVKVSEGSTYGNVDLTFRVIPKEAVAYLQENHESVLSLQARYTDTGSSHQDAWVSMPILQVSSDEEQGLLHLTASGESLGQEFYSGERQAGVQLAVAYGLSSVLSELIPVYVSDTAEPEYTVFEYTTTDGQKLDPLNLQYYISDEYDAEKNIGTMKFERMSVLPSYAFKNCATLESIVIPEEVVTIGAFAFDNCESLKSVVLPSGLQNIGARSFRDCMSLSSIDLPEGLISLGSDAFNGCDALTSVKLPEKISELADYTFYRCSNLTSVTLPDGLVSIRSHCFEECLSLTSIDLPAGLTSIGNDAFCDCPSLTSVDLPSGLTSLGDSAFRDCPSLTSVDLPSGLTSIGNLAFYRCESLTSVDLPSGLTSIGEYAFYRCFSLTSIDLPSGLTTLGDSAFENCRSLTSVDLPSGLTSLGDSAFYRCESLTSVDLPSGLTFLGDYVFSNCGSLTSVDLPSGLTFLGDYAFENCKSLTSVVLPSGLTSLGEYAFENCKSLTSIDLPSGLTSIGDYAFENCKSLTSVDLPSGLTSIGEYAFFGCESLTSADLPSGLTTLGDYAFYRCKSLTSVDLPAGLTSLGKYVFAYCRSLTSISLSDNLTYIYNGAFNYCSNLSTVTIPKNIQFIGYYVFSGCYGLASVYMTSPVPCLLGEYAFESDLLTIYVPEGSADAYKTAVGWRRYADRIQ